VRAMKPERGGDGLLTLLRDHQSCRLKAPEMPTDNGDYRATIYRLQQAADHPIK